MTKFLLLLPVATAFVVNPNLAARQATRALHYQVGESATPDTDIMNRAQECADHMGMCPLDEVKDLRDAIHDSRVENMFQNNIPPTLEDQLMVQRLLEDDLSLQLMLLQEEETFNLFPDDEEEEEYPATAMMDDGTMPTTHESSSGAFDHTPLWQYMMVM